MTREEAREELKQDYILLPIRMTFTGLDVLWLGALITERLARREAEARVKELEKEIYDCLDEYPDRTTHVKEKQP